MKSDRLLRGQKRELRPRIKRNGENVDQKTLKLESYNGHTPLIDDSLCDIKSESDEEKNSNLGPFLCHQCKRTFSYKQNLKRHIKNDHKKVKKCFSCDQCDFISDTKNELKRHVQFRHEIKKELKKFRCKDCSYQSDSKALLQRHIDAVHLKLRPFSCNVCKFTAKTQHHLMYHFTRKPSHFTA